ncbi:MAG: glycoside hydrolase family 10 protein [Pirellulaceae bacterium]
MTLCTLAILAGLGLSSANQVVDGFDYADDEAAQQVWADSGERGESSAVTMVTDGDRKVLQLMAPFAAQPELSRVYIDRKVDLDLADAGEFTLDILTSSPEAAGKISLYFHSSDGWYSAGSGLSGRGWSQLRFSKASFGIEQRPAGWHKVDTIRIAIWRGQAEDFTVRLGRLEAARHDVALIIPGAGDHPEHKAATGNANDVAEMIAELGLGSDAVEDSALVHGALGDRRVAILAYHPSLPDEAADALVRFVDRGGKLLVCYQLPRKIGVTLGFAQPTYVGSERPGQFTEIRFDAEEIQGLPPSVRQASWNITTAEPVGFNARVIGRWFDEDGKATGNAAMLLSDRGAFFSHIILRDDRAGKKRMLAAILGHLAPALWKQMAQSELDGVGQIGHFDDGDRLTEFLHASDNPDVRKHWEAAGKKLQAARKELGRAGFAQVVELSSAAHGELVQAYMLAQPSPNREGRAFWNHSGTGAYDGDWDRTAQELAAAGFNMILPNMLWGGLAHYPSDVLPRSTTYEKYGDQIAQCVAAAQKVGLEVHVWKVNFNLSGAPKEFVQKIHQEHRNQVSVDGAAHDWLCPSHPENFQLELESMLEVARRYPVDGLHFDYIRYPGRDKCYCDGCRKRFEADLGRKVTRWPNDCYSGPLREEYAQWRCDRITRLVKAVHDEAKKIRADLKISAAVFGSYPDCRASVAQDWPEWIKAGYLDFVCPMDYTQSDLNFMGLVNHQLKLVEGRIPIYPGIGQWRLSDDRTVGQIHHARTLGAAGFTIFNLTRGSAESVVPAIGVGVGKQKAVPPHRGEPTHE